MIYKVTMISPNGETKSEIEWDGGLMWDALKTYKEIDIDGKIWRVHSRRNEPGGAIRLDCTVNLPPDVAVSLIVKRVRKGRSA